MRRTLFRMACVSFLLSLCASLAPAQEGWGTQPAPTPQAQSSDPAQRLNADESFELNITERRITERDFAASTEVTAGEESARGLRLRIGVEVGASEIDVLLRNVRGRVRFRATLDRVLERLNARRASEAVP